jgi:hypothetical protein
MKEISGTEYSEWRKGKNLRVASSFTDVLGTNPLGYGVPSSDTEYSLDNKTVSRVEGRKYEGKDWEYKFYIMQD